MQYNHTVAKNSAPVKKKKLLHCYPAFKRDKSVFGQYIELHVAQVGN